MHKTLSKKERQTNTETTSTSELWKHPSHLGGSAVDELLKALLKITS